MELREFLSKYRLSEEAFRETDLNWDDLQEIGRDYNSLLPRLESVGRYVVDIILKDKIVHSINYRIKDTEHLLAKIIRKKIEYPELIITLENYRDIITDLIGIRALHLFKEDWISIHKYLMNKWEMAEQPTAYVRIGDSDRIIQFYKDNDCLVEQHKFGYRSAHYLLQSSPHREQFIVELQVRTLFEEAWGEIDHKVRYPYHLDNELLVRLSSILNRLSGDADEMASYMLYLKARQDQQEHEYRETLKSKNKLIAQLRHQIMDLSIDSAQKEAMAASLADLEKETEEAPTSGDQNLWLSDFMESPIFKGLQGQLNKFMQSEYFKPIEISEKDVSMLARTQSELIKLMQDPVRLQQMIAENMSEMPPATPLIQNTDSGDDA